MRIPTLKRRIPTLALAATSIMLAVSVQAEPIRITTVEAVWLSSSPGINEAVDLGVNPGAVVPGNQVFFSDGSVRAIVGFFTILDGTQAGTLQWAFDWPEQWEPPRGNLVQEFTFGPADIIVTGMDFPILYEPVPLSLTLSVPGIPEGGIIGPSTYTFSVVQPVPEPASMVLVGTGLAATTLARRRIRRARATDQA